MSDSWLVKKVKKMERIGNKANIDKGEYYFYNSPEGQMAEAVGHLEEVAYESLLDYEKAKKEEKAEAERERLEERLDRIRKKEAKCNAKEILPPAENAVNTNPIIYGSVPNVEQIPVVKRMRSKVIRAVILMADLFLLAISMGGAR